VELVEELKEEFEGGFEHEEVVDDHYKWKDLFLFCWILLIFPLHWRNSHKLMWLFEFLCKTLGWLLLYMA
jgi:hypothetical protein